MTKTALIDTLSAGVHTVTFTKVDGTVSSMQCTLDPALLPARVATESAKPKNDTVMSVFNVDKQAWRSFRVANVISVDAPVETQ